MPQIRLFDCRVNNETQSILIKSENIIAARDIHTVFSSSSFRGKVIFNFMENLQNELIRNKFSSHKPTSEQLKKMVGSEEKYIEWCERAIKGKKWANKGFFMSIAGESQFLLHIQFADKALHYGIVSPSGNDELPNISIEGWEKREWWGSFKWCSKIKDIEAFKFNKATLDLLTSKEALLKFVKEITDDFCVIFAAPSQPIEKKSGE